MRQKFGTGYSTFLQTSYTDGIGVRRINCILFLPFDRITEIKTLSSLEADRLENYLISAFHFDHLYNEKKNDSPWCCWRYCWIMIVKCNRWDIPLVVLHWCLEILLYSKLCEATIQWKVVRPDIVGLWIANCSSDRKWQLWFCQGWLARPGKYSQKELKKSFVFRVTWETPPLEIKTKIKTSKGLPITILYGI